MSTFTPGKATIDANTAQIQSEISTLLSSSDSSATNRLQNLTLVHQARLTGLKRTAVALSVQPGVNPDLVKSAEAAATTAASTAAQIEVVSRQITTPAPKVAATGWALHGRVFDANLQPVPGFAVFLVDAQKAYKSQYGFAYVDSTGYFLLTYDGASQSRSGAEQPPATESADAQLFIEIANDKGQPVYLSSTAFQPVPGSATYENITLPSDSQPIGAPPKSIRKIALPKLQKNQ